MTFSKDRMNLKIKDKHAPNFETAWIHQEKTLNSLNMAIAWARKNPPKSSDPDELPVIGNTSNKRKN